MTKISIRHWEIYAFYQNFCCLSQSSVQTIDIRRENTKKKILKKFRHLTFKKKFKILLSKYYEKEILKF